MRRYIIKEVIPDGGVGMSGGVGSGVYHGTVVRTLVILLLVTLTLGNL